MIAGRSERSGEGLRLCLPVRFHLITPCGIGEHRRIRAFRPQGGIFPAVENVLHVRIVGNECCRLQVADLIGFPQRCHDRQRRIERRHTPRVEPAAIKLCTTA